MSHQRREPVFDVSKNSSTQPARPQRRTRAGSRPVASSTATASARRTRSSGLFAATGAARGATGEYASRTGTSATTPSSARASDYKHQFTGYRRPKGQVIAMPIAIVVLSDPQSGSDEALGRVFNALAAAYDYKHAGDEVTLLFQGAGTRWVGALEQHDHPAHALFEAVATPSQACRAVAPTSSVPPTTRPRPAGSSSRTTRFPERVACRASAS